MIKVCDALMGLGKSSAAITYINEHPENVLTFLKEKLGLLKEKKDRDDKFNKRH